MLPVGARRVAKGLRRQRDLRQVGERGRQVVAQAGSRAAQPAACRRRHHCRRHPSPCCPAAGRQLSALALSAPMRRCDTSTITEASPRVKASCGWVEAGRRVRACVGSCEGSAAGARVKNSAATPAPAPSTHLHRDHVLQRAGGALDLALAHVGAAAGRLHTWCGGGRCDWWSGFASGQTSRPGFPRGRAAAEPCCIKLVAVAAMHRAQPTACASSPPAAPTCAAAAAASGSRSSASLAAMVPGIAAAS